MPLYTYTTDDGESFTEFFHMNDKPVTITVKDGEIAYYDFVATQLPSVSRDSTQNGSWPKLCDASGVHSSQVEKIKKIGSAQGVDMKFHPETGQAVYDNSSHRKSCLKVRGMIDRSRYA